MVEKLERSRIKIIGTSEKVGNYLVWQLTVDEHLMVSTYGPLAAATLGAVADLIEKGTELSALSVLPYNDDRNFKK